MKAKNGPVIIVILAAVIIIALIAGGVIDLPNMAVGDTRCKQTSTAQSHLTSFTCDSAECRVYGILTCDRATSEPKVTLRCSGSQSWYAYDITGDGSLDYLKSYGSFSPVTSWTQLGCCPNGECFGKATISGEMKYGYLSSGKFYNYAIAASPNAAYTSPTPQSGYSEITDTGSGYSCNWKLCPSSSLDQSYCNKLESAGSAWGPKQSSTIVMKQGDSISFSPTDAAGSLLDTAKSTLSITKFSCCTDQCNLGATKCSGTSSKQTCITATSGCTVWGDPESVSSCCSTSTDCNIGYVCSSGACQRDTNVCLGDSDCTSPKTCTISTGKCTCPTSGSYCGQNGVAVCQDSKTPKVCAASGSCYAWKVLSACSGNNVCSEGSCVSPGTITVSPATSYPAMSSISIKAAVSGYNGILSGTSSTITLYDSTGGPLVSASCYLAADNTCTATFAAGLPQSTSQYTAKATVITPTATLTSEPVGFFVYAGANVNIISDTIMYTNGPGVFYLEASDSQGLIPICSGTSQRCFNQWKVEITDAGGAVAASDIELIPQVQAGRVRVNYHISGPGKITIKASTVGGQIAAITSTRTDIEAQSPQLMIEHSFPGSINFGLGNRFEYKLYAPSNEPGARKVALDVLATNMVVGVDYQTFHKDITPIRSGTGSYYVLVDMPESQGQAYTFSITANQPGYNTATLNNIHVRATPPPVPPIADWTTLIAIGVGVALLIVILIFVLRRRR